MLKFLVLETDGIGNQAVEMPQILLLYLSIIEISSTNFKHQNVNCIISVEEFVAQKTRYA